MPPNAGPAFEVATVKPAKPGCRSRGQVKMAGRRLATEVWN